MAKEQLTVAADQADLRLDLFLKQVLPQDHSRTFLQQLIQDGKVTVNGQQMKAHYKVAADDEIVVDVPEMSSGKNPPAEKIALDIFYEDDDIIIVNKPAGMLVHPVEGKGSGTLVNALLHHCKTLASVGGPDRPGIVHRLDRETSGLMVAAKNDQAYRRLSRQFEKHEVKKQYAAWVAGELAFDEGVIDVPLGRHPIFWDKKAVSFEENARKALTFYRVIKRHQKERTLVALFPQSGRTHQLRVHMAHLGHPILGDDKYGGKFASAFPRLALHAQGLGFKHPQSRLWIEFFCPIPAEFRH